MPGINTTGTPNTNDYVIGRGAVSFADVDANGRPLGFRHLGNCPDFKVSLESEKIEHVSSLAGLKVVDKTVNTSLTAKVSFSLDEAHNFDNLAMFLSGTTGTVSQSSGTLAHSATNGNLRVPANGLGKWLDLYNNAMAATGFAYPPTSGQRVVRLSAVSVKNLAGSTTYVLGTDYELDLIFGRIKIVATGAITASQELSVEYTKAAVTIDQVNGLTSSSIVGAIKFLQQNAANNSVQSEWQFHACTLSPAGEHGLISDEIGALPFEASVESRPLVDATAPVVRVRYFANS